MKRSLIVPATVLLLCFVLADDHLATPQPPVKGGALQTYSLPVPKSREERDYLGLSGGRLFKIPSVKAEIVVIEVFGLYCPQCLKIAPALKDFYRRIENDPSLKGKIKLIGIGTGNSLDEVQQFKNATEAPFPLFPDKDFSIHKAFGEMRTPYFITINIK